MWTNKNIPISEDIFTNVELLYNTLYNDERD